MPLTTHIILVPRLRICGVIAPRLHGKVLVRQRENFTFTNYFQACCHISPGSFHLGPSNHEMISQQSRVTAFNSGERSGGLH
jgi:hypothetical protein